MKPVPKNNKGLGKLPKKVRNNMGYMSYGGKAKRKGYAYGSMVRSPMQAGDMSMSANPMMPRAQQGMMSSPMTNKREGMMCGGKAKKKM